MKYRFSLLAVLVVSIEVLVDGEDLNSSESGWKAGVAAVEITPEGPMWMSGYANRKKPATETEHALWAKALAIEDARANRAVLVSLDIVGIDRATSAAICNELKQKYGLEREQIALNCSHTHSGPAVGRNLQGIFFLEDSDWTRIDDYTEWLSGRVVAMVGRALDGIAPATLEWREGFSDIAVNRRSNPHNEVEELRAAGKLKGPSDHSLPILKVSNSDGDVRAIVFGYACHPTKLSGTFDRWCGDYAGFAQVEIEKAHSGAVAMFWQGCGGDQTPWPRGNDDVEKAKAVGREVAAAVEEGLAKPLQVIAGGLDVVYGEIELPLDEVGPRNELEAATRGKNLFKARLARVVLTRLEEGKEVRKSYRKYPVQTWRLGSGPKWVFLGGEVVVDYSLGLKKELGALNTWVAGYSNDVMAYIPSERVLGEGGYEGKTSMVYYNLPAAWAPGIEDAITNEVRTQIRALYSSGVPSKAVSK